MNIVNERFQQVIRIGAVILSLLLQFLFMTAGLPQQAQAAPGDLDPSFGIGGKVTTDFSPGIGWAYSVAIQADGKIVAAGYVVGTVSQFALVRYKSDGSLDPSFGTGGKVTTDFAPFNSQASSVAIQADGKIVAAGSAGSDFALARYTSDGSLDTSFGTGGKVTTDFGPFGSGASSVAIQADGKIVAAGSAGSDFFATGKLGSDFALARYNSDGSLDTTFGTGGKVTTHSQGCSNPPPYFLAPCYSVAYSLAILADGNILLVGRTTDGNTAFEMGVSWGFGLYSPAGNTYFVGGSDFAIDNAFRYEPREYPTAFSVAIQADGKIVVAGRAPTYNTVDFALMRMNYEGSYFSYDTTFGTDGKVTTDFGPLGALGGGASSAAIQADGKIVAVGSTSVSEPASDFALARYNSDGSLDTTFGTGGKVTTDFGPGDEAHSVAIQADGKIVAAGFTFNMNTGLFEFALARYLNFKEVCSYLGNNPNPWIPDIDIFKFIGIKDETVTIRIEASPPEAGTGKRVTLILTDKIKGTVLLKLDRSELPNEITAKLPGTGEYLIAVAEQVLTTKDKRYKGNYCLTLKAQPETSQTLAPALWVE
jgi:uncharacterized delta-60 repeat protein